MPDLEDLTYEEILKEMELTTLKIRSEREVVAIYKLMNNLRKQIEKI